MLRNIQLLKFILNNHSTSLEITYYRSDDTNGNVFNCASSVTWGLK